MLKPTIDVIIPTHNGEKWIGEALESILGQTCAVQRILIVDDSSVDRTREIALTYKGVEFFHSPQSGMPSVSRNYGASLSSAEYIAFLDQDDLWHPRHVEWMTEVLESSPACDVVAALCKSFSDGQPPIFDTSDLKVQKLDPWEEFPFLHMYEPSLLLFRRRFFERCQWPEVKGGYSDYCMRALIPLHSDLLRLNAHTVARRRHPNTFYYINQRTIWEELDTWRSLRHYLYPILKAGMDANEFRRIEPKFMFYDALPDAVQAIIEKTNRKYISAFEQLLSECDTRQKNDALRRFRNFLDLYYAKAGVWIRIAAFGYIPDACVSIKTFLNDYMFKTRRTLRDAFIQFLRHPLSTKEFKIFFLSALRRWMGRKPDEKVLETDPAHVQYLKSWSGSAPAFLHPEFLAIDQSGNVYVSDPDLHCIIQFNAEGELLRKLDNAVIGYPLFVEPEGIALAKDGSLFVVDSYSGMVSKFDAEFHVITSTGGRGKLPGQLNHAESITLSPTGLLYVADANNSRISVFDSNCQFQFSFGEIGFGDGQFNSPQSVRMDSKGRLWVVDMYNHRLQIFDQHGKFLRRVGRRGERNGEFQLPSGLCIDHHDNVYVCDIGNHRIQVFDADGQFRYAFGKTSSGYLGTVLDVAVDQERNVYITDATVNKIHKFKILNHEV